MWYLFQRCKVKIIIFRDPKVGVIVIRDCLIRDKCSWGCAGAPALDRPNSVNYNFPYSVLFIILQMYRRSSACVICKYATEAEGTKTNLEAPRYLL